MAEGVTEISTEDRPCFDPECEGIAEAESDGELMWFTCLECGSEFGYLRIAQQDASCQMGVPESIRRAGSGLQPEPSVTRIQLTKKT